MMKLKIRLYLLRQSLLMLLFSLLIEMLSVLWELLGMLKFCVVKRSVLLIFSFLLLRKIVFVLLYLADFFSISLMFILTVRSKLLQLVLKVCYMSLIFLSLVDNFMKKSCLVRMKLLFQFLLSCFLLIFQSNICLSMKMICIWMKGMRQIKLFQNNILFLRIICLLNCLGIFFY